MNNMIKKSGKKNLESITKILPKPVYAILSILRTHQSSHFKHTKKFNDYATNLKIGNYNNNPLITRCTDKYKIREYMKKRGYKEFKLYFCNATWNKFNYIKDSERDNKKILKPSILKEMIGGLESLLKEFSFVMDDLHNSGGKNIFGELAITQACNCALYYNKIENNALKKC